jgi:putative polyhydroxyalkanoate system protein
MSDMKIHRDHDLGLEKAGRIAGKWADFAGKKFDLQCSVTSSPSDYTVVFTRQGVTGKAVFTASTIDAEAKFGFLLRPFIGKIESEAGKMLDAALAKEAAKGA